MKTKFKLVKDTSSFQITWKAKSVKELLDDEWVLKWVEVEWYASTKDKDRWGDIVEPEAFKNALEMYMLNPIVLLQHDMDKPIWVVEDARIDEKGLYIKAKITENEDWVFSKLVNGVLRSFSIWYRVKDYEDRDVYNSEWVYMWSEFVIKDLELYEISVVSVPMNPYALCKSMSDCFEKEEEVEETQEVVEETQTPEQAEETNTVDWPLWTHFEPEDDEVEPDKVAEVMEHEIAETEAEEKEEAESVEETVEETTEEVKECETTVEQMDEIIDEAKEEETVEEEKVEEAVEETKEIEENSEETPIDTVSENTEKEEVVEEWINNNETEETVEEVKSEEEEVKETVEETEIDWEDKIPEDQESENVVETTTDEKVDKGLNLKEMSRKSIETFILSETKSIKENVLEEVKSLITKKDEEIADLKEKLANTQKALTICAELVWEIDSALSNTALKSWFAYEKPQAKKQNSAYLKVAEFLKAKA